MIVCGLTIGLLSPGLLLVGDSDFVLALISPTMACSSASMSPLPCQNSAREVEEGWSSSITESKISPSGDNLKAFLFYKEHLCA